MAFPNVIVECAFDNDVNEYLYAQAGYSDITGWVRSISGDLRGRRYEMDKVETGSVRLELDNADGRFTPHSELSPYFPFVKPSRRLRIRGRNKQRLSLATAGSTYRSTKGFSRALYLASASPSDPALVASTGTNSPLRTLVHNNEIRDPDTTSTLRWAGSASTTRSITSDGWYRMLTTIAQVPHTYALPIGSRFPAVTGDKVAMSVRLRGMDTKDLWARIYVAEYDAGGANVAGGVMSAYTKLPMGEEVVLQVAGVLTNAATTGTLPIVYFYGSAVGAVAAINDYVDFTEDYYEHGALAPSSVPFDVTFSGDTADRLDKSGVQYEFEWTGTANDSASTQISHPIGAGTHHIEVTVPNGTASGAKGLVEWNVPVELGRRTIHSVYVHKVSGTEPAGTMTMVVRYFNASGTVLTEYAGNGWSFPSPSTPTFRFAAHTPPPTAQYATATLYTSPTAAYTSDVVYAIDAIMSMNTPSLALNPYGQWDANHWYVTGTNSTVPVVNSTDLALEAVMAADGTDTELYTYIGGTVPGETYTAAVELRHLNAALGNPTTSLRLTADEGLTSVVVAANTAYATATLTFVADSTSQKLSIQMSDGSPFLANWVVRARKLAVVPGTVSPGLHVVQSTTHDTGTQGWEAPMPVFEGWVEAWPARVNPGSTSVVVVANDRLRRIGGITLDNTWREAVFADTMELIVPFDDDPVDAAGKAAQIGLWASSAQVIEIPVMATRTDIGASTYVLGVDGPADPTALEMNPISNTAGYFWPVPYSRDYVTGTPPAAPPPAPKPPATPPTYTIKQYVKTYYATWSRTYEGDGATTWDDSPLMYQGYFDGNRGHTRSLAGFNYLAIKADLAGATIKSVKATFDNEESHDFSGSRIYVGTHTYSSKPSTWSTASVVERRASAVHGYGKLVTVELGVTVGNEFKAGTTKGVAVGPAPNTDRYYYSKYRGASQSGKPYLTITYTKKVAV